MTTKIRINLSVSSVKKLNEEMDEIRKLSKFNDEKIVVNAEIEEKDNVADVASGLYKAAKLSSYQGGKLDE